MLFHRLRFLLTTLTGCLVIWPLSAQPGLKGEYYRGTNFEQKVLTRVDPMIQFNWSARAPMPELDWSYYSVRWTGQLQAPVSGRYVFYSQVDDGIRLWVGNRLVIDEWHLTPYRHFQGEINLVAGQTYPIRIDYFNDIRGGQITLRWERPDQPARWFEWLGEPGEVIPATFFRQPPRPVPPPPKPAISSETKAIQLTRKTLPIKPKLLPTDPKMPLPQPLAVRSQPPSANVSSPINKQTVSAPTPPALAQPITLLFDQSSYVLTESSRRQLDSVLAHWRANPPAQIDVVGHADQIGDRALNRTLSEFRTRVVVNYLRNQGIDSTQLRGLWHGDTQLLIDTNNPVLRCQNRRVVLMPYYK